MKPSAGKIADQGLYGTAHHRIIDAVRFLEELAVGALDRPGFARGDLVGPKKKPMPTLRKREAS